MFLAVPVPSHGHSYLPKTIASEPRLMTGSAVLAPALASRGLCAGVAHEVAECSRRIRVALGATPPRVGCPIWWTV